jgi:signal transduction histidine kinase
LLPLVGIWVFSTAGSFESAVSLLNAKVEADNAGTPSNPVLVAVQAERKLSMAYVSLLKDKPALTIERERTDAAIADFRRLSTSDTLQNTIGDLTRYHLNRLNEALDKLKAARGAIDRNEWNRLQVLDFYTDIVIRTFAMYTTISTLDNRELTRQVVTIMGITEAREVMSREDALINAILVSGKPTAPDIAELGESVGTNRYLLETVLRNLTPEEQVDFQPLLNSPAYKDLRAIEDKLTTQSSPSSPLPVDGLWWKESFTQVDNTMFKIGDDAAQRAINSATPIAVGVMLRLGIAGGLGLIIIIVLIWVSSRIARSLIRRITEVRQRALRLAHEELPTTVAKLRKGEDVDIPQQVLAEPDELGQLANAFSAVQQTAIESAVQEAALRSGLNQVFLNIGRRSQTLVHRQLSLLETMERRVSDPHQLEEIFKVDHLAVRMRRYAEDLVILAGAVPGRGWRNPVPLADVLRSAMSEVEDYTRISVIPAPAASLAGRAVSDVIHLVAELLENATAFSPRDTRVKLAGQVVPNGFAVEIEDRGVGLPAEALLEANDRLTNPPDFDPAQSARLGLFVVARLAARHGIKVTLQASPYGGVTAVVLLPNDIIVTTGGEQAKLDGPHRAITGSAISSTPAQTPPPVRALGPAEIPTLASPVLVKREPMASTALDGLPVRSRQANLAPQLRESAAVTIAEEIPAPRPPSQSRALLSSLQEGVNRGRQASEHTSFAPENSSGEEGQ